MGLFPQPDCLSQKNILGRIELNWFALILAYKRYQTVCTIYLLISFIPPICDTSTDTFFKAVSLPSRLMSGA